MRVIARNIISLATAVPIHIAIPKIYWFNVGMCTILLLDVPTAYLYHIKFLVYNIDINYIIYIYDQ